MEDQERQLPLVVLKLTCHKSKFYFKKHNSYIMGYTDYPVTRSLSKGQEK